MEMILNKSLRPYHFNFYLKGKLVTVVLGPGASRVKKEHIDPLREIRTFAVLEDDDILVVGVKGKAAADAKDAPELVDNKDTVATTKGKAPMPPKKGKGKKKTTKKTSTTGDSGVGDLKDL